MKFLFPILYFLLILCMSSCFYDKESVLYPQGVCDTAAVKWSTTIQPIMQSQCAYAGCHSTSDAAGGVILSTYNGVHAVAQDGSLVGSVSHDGHYSNMPLNREKLPDCSIAQIRIWVAGGAQQN